MRRLAALLIALAVAFPARQAVSGPAEPVSAGPRQSCRSAKGLGLVLGVLVGSGMAAVVTGKKRGEDAGAAFLLVGSVFTVGGGYLGYRLGGRRCERAEASLERGRDAVRVAQARSAFSLSGLRRARIDGFEGASAGSEAPGSAAVSEGTYAALGAVKGGGE